MFLIGTSVASASSKPKVQEIKDREKDTITIRISYDKYKSKDVDVIVSVRNKETDETIKTTFKDKKLDSAGKRNIEIGDLSSGTKYSFKVKIKKHKGDGDYSNWSDSLSGKTKS